MLASLVAARDHAEDVAGRTHLERDWMNNCTFLTQEPNIKHTNAFPKDSASPHFEIHTDTAVSLAVEQVELLVCLPMEADSLGLLHLSVRGLALVSAAGLDKESQLTWLKWIYQDLLLLK